MFKFECEIINKYEKEYLLDPQFTSMWLFDLNKPFFINYPKTKEDILNEKYLTMSEICKIIDEAEWHFWNSHEKNLSNEVWAEIYDWHLRGPGANFATTYFDMIAKETGVSIEKINSLCALQGEHLSRFKWS